MDEREPKTKNCVIHRCHPRLCNPHGKAKDRYCCMFRLIQVWLDHCLRGHPTCTKSILPKEESSIVPTRLIDIGCSESAQEPRLVKYSSLWELLQATNSARYLGYATLSYCWGHSSSAEFALRENNEAEFLRAIPSSSLPRTIRDAFQICRRIGIQCIWIDALCILQNSKGQSLDWQKESTRVGIYYNQALVTITNARASSNNEACLPQSQWRNTSRLTWNYAKQTMVAIRKLIWEQDTSDISLIGRRGELR